MQPIFQRTVFLKIAQVPAPLSNFPPLLQVLPPLNYSLVPSIFSQDPIYWTNFEGSCCPHNVTWLPSPCLALIKHWVQFLTPHNQMW